MFNKQGNGRKRMQNEKISKKVASFVLIKNKIQKYFVSLQKIGCTRQIESKLSLCSFALS